MSGENENMSAGTIRLTNGSTAVVGTGTTFTSDLKSGDVITTTIGGVFYTLFVDTVTSNTAATLTDPFTGPTTTGAAWVAVPAMSLNRITAALATQTAEAVRRILQDNANWQAFYSGTGDIVVTLPDGTPTGRQITGPSWAKLKADAGSAWIDRGPLSTTVNLNTMNPATTEGEYGKASSTGLNEANGFPPGASVGVLKVVAGGRFGGTQIYTDWTGNQWVRGLTAVWNGTDGPWSAWGATDGARGAIPNADLDTFTTGSIGRWAVLNSTFVTAANHYPVVGSGGIGEFEVAAGGNILQQTMKTRYGRMFTRTIDGTWNGTGIPAWTVWLEIGVQPQDTFYSDDMNLLVTPGTFNISNAVNSPSSSVGICRVSLRANNTQVLQEFYVVGGGSNANRKYSRTLAGGTWTPWDPIMGQTEFNTQMAAFGIGAANPTISNFDWQTFNFTNGTSYQVAGASQVNAPAPIDGLNNMSLGVNVLGMSGDPSSTTAISWCLMLVSGYVNGTGSTRRMFHVIFRGTNGTRSYSVMELSAGTDVADMRSRIGLGNAATRNVGTTPGTVAAGDDSRLNTVNGKTGGTITSAVSVTGQLGANNLFAATAPAPNTQGTHIGWNAETGTGATDIYNNRGGGNGGFNFRIVNVTNTQELQKFQFRYDGVGLAPGGWQTGSDIHLKENVTPVTRALPAVLSLTGTTWLYKRRKGGSETLTPGVGLIAQQVENICPVAVATHKELTYFEDDTALLEHKSLDVSGVSAAYHNEAIKALFALVKLALDDPSAARQQIADIEAEAQGLTISLEDLQREQVAVPTETPIVEEPESPDTSAGDENQSDIQS